MNTNLIGISGKIGSGKDTFAKMIQLVVYNNVYINKGEFVEPTVAALDNISKIPNAYLSKWEVKKFADKLKDITCILIGCTREQLEDQKFKDSNLPEEWDIIHPDWDIKTRWPAIPPYLWKFPDTTRKSMTVREVLQRVGTDCMRDQLHQQVWVNALFSTYSTGRYFMCDECGAEDIKEIKEEDTCPICKFKSESNLTMVFEDNYSKWIVTDVRFPNELEAIKQRGGIVFRIERAFFKGSSMSHESETALDNYFEFDQTIYNKGSLYDLYEKAKNIVETYNLK